MADSSVDTLARTIYGEARGELYGGRVAVANVVMNRVVSPIMWWGYDVGSVCKAQYQFSCWLESDPNRRVIEAVTESDPDFVECLQIAQVAVAGRLDDVTFGSTHYHARTAHPAWAKGQEPVIQIGAHAFYNGVDR